MTKDEEIEKIVKGEISFGLIRIGENIGLNTLGGFFGSSQRLRQIAVFRIVAFNVGVHPPPGGSIDGLFTVNDMTNKIAENLSDATTGKFFNHGTISAANEDFTINGDLISDGTLQIQNGKIFVVNGTADLTNTKIEILDAEKNVPIKILSAKKIICENVKILNNAKIEIIGDDLFVTCL